MQFSVDAHTPHSCAILMVRKALFKVDVGLAHY